MLRRFARLSDVETFGGPHLHPLPPFPTALSTDVFPSTRPTSRAAHAAKVEVAIGPQGGGEPSTPPTRYRPRRRYQAELPAHLRQGRNRPTNPSGPDGAPRYAAPTAGAHSHQMIRPGETPTPAHNMDTPSLSAPTTPAGAPYAQTRARCDAWPDRRTGAPTPLGRSAASPFCLHRRRRI